MDGTVYETNSEDIVVTFKCCAPLANPTLSSSQSGFCGTALDTSGTITLGWSAVSASDYYEVYRRGSYTDPNNRGDWELIHTIDDPAATSYDDHNVQSCVGCVATNVKYDYYVAPIIKEEPDCDEEGNIEVVTINCCNKAPTTTDQSFETDFETKLSGRVIAKDHEGNISSYTFVSPASGTLTSDTTTGEFSFIPASNFYTSRDGTVTFTWTATDACSQTSSTSGTVTITVNTPIECSEYNYIICNAQIPWLTEQQDIAGIRQKITTLTQVPFMLNSKGVPSLRKRCGAYTVTRGLNPSVLALADDDCE